MKKAILAVLAMSFAGAVWAACTTHTYQRKDGRITTCTTCCYNGNCQTTCY